MVSEIDGGGADTAPQQRVGSGLGPAGRGLKDYWANVDAPWAHLAKQNFPPVEEMVAFGSIKLKNIKSNVQNVFWQDVISSWADFCAIYKPDNFELLTDKLWYSDNTKFKKSIVREWNNKGLRFIADLFCKHTGALLSRNSLNEIFNLKMTLLCYSSLIRSIPTSSAKFRESLSQFQTDSKNLSCRFPNFCPRFGLSQVIPDLQY